MPLFNSKLLTGSPQHEIKSQIESKKDEITYLPSEVKEAKDLATFLKPVLANGSENIPLKIFKDKVQTLMTNLLDWVAEAYQQADEQKYQQSYCNNLHSVQKQILDYEGGNDENNEKIFRAYKDGLPGLDNLLNIVNKQKTVTNLAKIVMMNLLDDINVCFPGIYVKVSTAFIDLNPQLDVKLKSLRYSYAKSKIAKHLSQYPNLNDRDFHTHNVTALTNYFSESWYIDKFEDYYALDIQAILKEQSEGKELEEEPTNFVELVKELAVYTAEITDLNKLFQSLVDAMLVQIQDAEKSTRSYDEKQTEIRELLNNCGVDTDYSIYHLYDRNTYQLKAESELREQLRITLLMRLAFLGYADMSGYRKYALSSNINLYADYKYLHLAYLTMPELDSELELEPESKENSEEKEREVKVQETIIRVPLILALKKDPTLLPQIIVTLQNHDISEENIYLDYDNGLALFHLAYQCDFAEYVNHIVQPIPDTDRFQRFWPQWEWMLQQDSPHALQAFLAAHSSDNERLRYFGIYDHDVYEKCNKYFDVLITTNRQQTLQILLNSIDQAAIELLTNNEIDWLEKTILLHNDQALQLILSKMTDEQIKKYVNNKHIITHHKPKLVACNSLFNEIFARDGYADTLGILLSPLSGHDRKQFIQKQSPSLATIVRLPLRREHKLNPGIITAYFKHLELVLDILADSESQLKFLSVFDILISDLLCLAARYGRLRLLGMGFTMLSTEKRLESVRSIDYQYGVLENAVFSGCDECVESVLGFVSDPEAKKHILTNLNKSIVYKILTNPFLSDTNKAKSLRMLFQRYDSGVRATLLFDTISESMSGAGEHLLTALFLNLQQCWQTLLSLARENLTGDVLQNYCIRILLRKVISTEVSSQDCHFIEQIVDLINPDIKKSIAVLYRHNINIFNKLYEDKQDNWLNIIKRFIQAKPTQEEMQMLCAYDASGIILKTLHMQNDHEAMKKFLNALKILTPKEIINYVSGHSWRLPFIQDIITQKNIPQLKLLFDLFINADDIYDLLMHTPPYYTCALYKAWCGGDIEVINLILSAVQDKNKTAEQNKQTVLKCITSPFRYRDDDIRPLKLVTQPEVIKLMLSHFKDDAEKLAELKKVNGNIYHGLGFYHSTILSDAIYSLDTKFIPAILSSLEHSVSRKELLLYKRNEWIYKDNHEIKPRNAIETLLDSCQISADFDSELRLANLTMLDCILSSLDKQDKKAIFKDIQQAGKLHVVIHLPLASALTYDIFIKIFKHYLDSSPLQVEFDTTLFQVNRNLLLDFLGIFFHLPLPYTADDIFIKNALLKAYVNSSNFLASYHDSDNSGDQIVSLLKKLDFIDDVRMLQDHLQTVSAGSSSAVGTSVVGIFAQSAAAISTTDARVNNNRSGPFS